jgi:diguanylate cyclase
MRNLPAWLVAAGITGLFCVGYILSPSSAHETVFVVAVVIGSTTVVVVATKRPLRRGAWLTLAAGVGLMAVGDLLWSGHELLTGESPPFPSVADVGYLGGVAAMIVGLFLLVRNPERTRHSEAVLDVGVLTLAGALLLWHTVIDELLHDHTLSPFATAVAVAYPLLDIALLAVLGALILVPRQRIPALYFVGGAALSLLIADLLYALALAGDGYVSGSIADLGWMAMYGLLAAAVLHPSSKLIGGAAAPEPGKLSTRRILLLWAIVVATATIVVSSVFVRGGGQADDVFRHLTAAVITTVAMGTLVLVRLSVTATALAETLADRRRLQDRLEHQAGHDELTGLANRRQFTDVVTALDGHPDTAVAFMDLDRFKDVNDQHGHAAGDELLRIVADRLRGTLRSDAMAARFGGDEFAVLLPATTLDAACDVGQRLIDVLSAPVTLAKGRLEVQVGASVGVAVSSLADPPGRDLVHDADVAMYASKRAGRGRVTPYSTDVHREALTQLTMQTDLRQAVALSQLSLEFQPILSVGGRRTVAAEALLRWDHPAHGRIPPATFIPIAEASGDIHPIGAWVLREACEHAARWNQERDEPVAISVNVSPEQLRDEGFADLVTATLELTRLDPRLLTLEITESALLEVHAATRARIAQLRQLGVRFALDDFGTGYSALRYLREVPLDELKIDRAFVSRIADSVEDAALAFAILHIADTLGLQTVAEGVETHAQLEVLQQRDCQMVQGFLLARPMRASAFLDHLAAEDRHAEPGRIPTPTPSGGGVMVSPEVLAPRTSAAASGPIRGSGPRPAPRRW